jgi:hypothetical protein
MPIISQKKLHNLKCRVEAAENFIMEDPLARQKEYLDDLNTLGEFSREVYISVSQCEEAIRKFETEKARRL